MRGFGALILIAVVVTAAVFVADHPGRVEIVWQGWQAQTSVGVLIAALLVVLAVLGILAGILRGIVRLPLVWRRHRRERRREAGYAALGGGFAALAAGDPAEAQRSARRAALLLDESPATLVLSAQAAQLAGDDIAAHRSLTVLLDRPETRLLGLRGLLAEAVRAGDDTTALALAERAYRLRPQLGWAVETLLSRQLRAAQWERARDTLADAARRHLFPPERVRRHRSAILVELSRAAERDGDLRQGASLAAQAAALTPDRAAPPCEEARLLLALGRTRAAAKRIEQAWQTAPHPDLARLHDDTGKAATPLARFEAAERLAAKNPEAEDSHIAVAEAALAARLWGETRRHLGKAIAAAPPPGPSRRLCRLMARLEESEHGDAGEARLWLDRAVTAPPDPHYACSDCGGESPSWQALCPHCGNFDTLAWQIAAPVPARPPLIAATPLLAAPTGLAPLRQ